MEFSKNRKGRGVILTGVFIVPAAISLTQQGVVSAGWGYGQALNGDVFSVKDIIKTVWTDPHYRAVVIAVFGLILIGILVVFIETRIQLPDGLPENERKFYKLIATTGLERIHLRFFSICGELINREAVTYTKVSDLERALKKTIELWGRKKRLEDRIGKKMDISFKELFYDSLYRCVFKNQKGRPEGHFLAEYSTDGEDLINEDDMKWESFDNDHESAATERLTYYKRLVLDIS